MNIIGKRIATDVLGFPDDHPCLLGCHWFDHYQSERTDKLMQNVKWFSRPVYGVTGASGSGKDSFVEMVEKSGQEVLHVRFGDVMKDLAYELGLVPYSRQECEENRELRFEVLPTGKTVLATWIELDFLRELNPFVFVQRALEQLTKDLLVIHPVGEEPIIVFSGMRTEVGLSVVMEMADEMIRVEREGHESHKDATLDELQVCWPVDTVVRNDGTLEELKNKAISILSP